MRLRKCDPADPRGVGMGCTESSSRSLGLMVSEATSPSVSWFPGHLSFLLGAHHHIGVSYLMNTECPGGWHSPFQGVALEMVPCAFRRAFQCSMRLVSLSAICDIKQCIPWPWAHSQTLFTMKWIPWSYAMLSGTPCLWVRQSGWS